LAYRFLLLCSPVQLSGPQRNFKVFESTFEKYMEGIYKILVLCIPVIYF